MSFRLIVQFCVALVLTPIVTFVSLFALGYFLDSSGQVDAEGIAYLIFFTLSAMPGVVIGLIVAHFAFRSLKAVHFLAAIGLAAVASAVVSMAVYPAVWFVMGLLDSFQAAGLVIPGFAGIIGAIVLLLLERSTARSAAHA